MSADWNKPSLSDLYANFRQFLSDRLNDAALMFNSATVTATNLPTGTIRWNSTSSKFEIWSGSAWGDLTALYGISISGNAQTATTAGTAGSANGLAAGVALANLVAGSIPYADLQNISATQRVIGRNSAGAGAAEEVTPAQLTAWIGPIMGVSTVAKSAAYTVVAADRGKLFNYTSGSYTVSLTAAATLGDGFSFALRNSGTGVITIDPNASETIDGAATISLAVNETCIVTCDGTAFYTIGRSSSSASAYKEIQPITASVASNALTCTLNPTVLDFRSSTLGSGAVNTRTVGSAISCIVPSGATMGCVNAVQSRLAVLAIDNAGTVELAVVNIAGGVNLDETGLISTTALSAAADNNNVAYSTTARTSVPYRVVGYVESTQATAGTWATAPSTVQGRGGQACAAMSSLGVGQSWQDLLGSRSASTTYYNTTGKAIVVIAYTSDSSSATMTLAGSTYNAIQVTAPPVMCSLGIVGVGQSYSVAISGTFDSWKELR